MYARRRRPPDGRRRGVVLILVLAMMGLLAVIGVSFATFSGQARSGAIAYRTKLSRPRPDAWIEYAISQLINDTTNPMSALYGHGLKSDMYGNDAVQNGVYDRNPYPDPANANDYRPKILSIVSSSAPDVTANGAPAAWVVNTNVPADTGRSFIGWVLRLPAQTVTGTFHASQTFSVVAESAVGGLLQLGLTGGHRGSDPLSLIEPNTFLPMPFELDGRYRHGFNGTGMAALNQVVATGLGAAHAWNQQAAQFANFRVSGGVLTGAPGVEAPFDIHSTVGIDEDYDAPDLENWFLAVQSADGSVTIPSFHRPGILTDEDWTSGSVVSRSKILRPLNLENPTAGFRDLTPDVDLDGDGDGDAITYDVDNDGDGVTDSVWLDLGFPVQRAEDGSLYKPLFSFMVLGLNGRMPLNTAGNLNARMAADVPATTGFDEAGMPLFDHASHLGYSPTEINPLYALQNAYDDSTDPLSPAPFGNYPESDPTFVKTDNSTGAQKPVHSQFDDAEYDDTTGLYSARPGSSYRYIPVALSQLRALLTGTRVSNNEGDSSNVLVDGVAVGGGYPNNVVDPDDPGLVAGTSIDRTNSRPVPGRWGEADLIPTTLTAYSYPVGAGDTVPDIAPALKRALNFSSTALPSAPGVVVPNPIRAGRSPGADSQYLYDALDDDYNSYDFYPPLTARSPTNSEGGPEAGAVADTGTSWTVSNAYDRAGRSLLASERIRRFVTPIDAAGIGVVTRYDQPPGLYTGTPNVEVYGGLGPDRFGRVGFFNYFRPPGVPLDDDEGNRLIARQGADPLSPSYPLALSRHNTYRGYESLRNPRSRDLVNNANRTDTTPDGLPDFPAAYGAMPYNRSNNGPGYLPRLTAAGAARPVPPTDLFAPAGAGGTVYVGTFDDTINHQVEGKLAGDALTASYVDSQAVAVNAFPFGSLLHNDPNEMNSYWNDPNDAPFGPPDLEYLYRRQDVDGPRLNSRLADLAPISFEAAVDADRRRRLFSIETWDRIDATFAHDNPFTTYPGTTSQIRAYNAAITAPTPFLSPADPSVVNMVAATPQPARASINARFLNSVGASFENLGAVTPSVAHRARKINLNYPLPHSYDPQEPTRQKWITEAYQTLKLILPPQSIDTAQELADLGQFVVNIVDFRDPDNTITIWSNPDVAHLPARQVDGVDYPPSIHIAYRADGTADPFFNGHEDAGGTVVAASAPLQHFGMEYQPVAINEVLGFQFNYADPDVLPLPTSPSDPPLSRNKRANRLYIELVNMLSEPGAGPATPPGQELENASNLDLGGWDFVLVKEDPTPNVAEPYFAPAFVRPDPITGQLPGAAGVTIPPIRPDTDTSAGPTPGATPQEIQAQPVVIATGEAIEDRSDPDTAHWTVAHEFNLATAPVTAPARTGPIEALEEDEANYYVLGGLLLEGDTVPIDDPSTTDPDDGYRTLQTGMPDRGDREYEIGVGNAGGWALIPRIDDPALSTDAGMYYWLYLRRPANPLLPPQPDPGLDDYNPMVVVDSIRFPFSRSNGTGETSLAASGAQDDSRATEPTQPIYSIERPQPYRGGQLVPNPASTDQPLFIYGSSEQARPAREGNGRGRYNSLEPPFDNDPDETNEGENGGDGDNVANDGVFTTVAIHNSIGRNEGNRVSEVAGVTPDENEAWDYLAFNDRDFVSVAELMLVPGCPPGLFTKQFVELQPTFDPATYPDPPIPPVLSDFTPSYTATVGYVTPTSADSPGAAGAPGDGTPDRQGLFSPLPFTDGTHIPNATTPGVTDAFPRQMARTYPYLAHEFFYTSSPDLVVDPNDDLGLASNTATVHLTTVNHITGGRTAAGWHRMLEFFEVPVPLMDAIGPVEQGVNFDWYRQDLRPGQLNPNLIIDEEVFFGLVDDPRMLNPNAPLASMFDVLDPANSPFPPFIPRVVTQVEDLTGRPAASYPMANNGFTLFTQYYDSDGDGVAASPTFAGDLSTAPTSLDLPWSGMKIAFSDFLKQRHGGSGFLFAFGEGPTGTPFDDNDTTVLPEPNLRVARDRPYRSAAHYDIHSTLLRPATMEPSLYTEDIGGIGTPGTGDDPAVKSSGPADPRNILDPGFSYLPTAGNPRTFYQDDPTRTLPVVPPIPPRRLFQVPDAHVTTGNSVSNASLADATNGNPTTHIPIVDANARNVATTFPLSGAAVRGTTLFQTPSGPRNQETYLGYRGSSTLPEAVVPTTEPALPAPGIDTRRHPYYRTELLQKLANLTTPRTHQYAVWLTVGLFEVVTPGDRAQLVPDTLGPELGSATGSIVRYRSFFILDRSRATGYDPRNPGDYREVVVYSRRIE